MTIKIIGYDRKIAVINKTCKQCGAKLEFSVSDVQTYKGRDLGGCPEGQEYVVCPNCGKRVILRSW